MFIAFDLVKIDPEKLLVFFEDKYDVSESIVVGAGFNGNFETDEKHLYSGNRLHFCFDNNCQSSFHNVLVLFLPLIETT